MFIISLHVNIYYAIMQKALKEYYFFKKVNGAWLSLVEHLTGGQGVAGSNPVAPTIKKPSKDGFFVLSRLQDMNSSERFQKKTWGMRIE